ncbi:hypothetical protein QT381_11955 [Galbitalea sp. SE-J8]|uniref:hypothetical protein n=1 Tax=Galbitalea sp. SE-J8 TaxID=3054952 RepID=UPI00259CEFD4|nr:hypothetical protein [Galbitalea sp. SE-J8]MDM4763722.1 hypothetical protein [Galbitalea sp. SE-J8]
MRRAARLMALVLALTCLVAVDAAHADDPADADGDPADAGGMVVITGRLVGPQLPGYSYWAFLEGGELLDPVGDPVKVDRSGRYAFTPTLSDAESFAVVFAASKGATPPAHAGSQISDDEDDAASQTTAVITHKRSRSSEDFGFRFEVSPATGHYAVPAQHFTSISGRLAGAKRIGPGTLKVYSVRKSAKSITTPWRPLTQLTLSTKTKTFAWPLLMNTVVDYGAVSSSRKWALCFFSQHAHTYEQDACTAGFPWVKKSKWLTATSTHGIHQLALKLPRPTKY